MNHKAMLPGIGPEQLRLKFSAAARQLQGKTMFRATMADRGEILIAATSRSKAIRQAERLYQDDLCVKIKPKEDGDIWFEQNSL